MNVRGLVCVVGIALALAETASAQSQLREHIFHVVVPGAFPDEVALEKIKGNERPNNAQNRLSMVSAAQSDFPAPETACGPIALLNTIIWYERYGLIEPLFRDADEALNEARLFAEIDARLSQQAGRVRTADVGSRMVDMALVLDAIVAEQSSGRLRMHTDLLEAPVQLDDLLRTMPNFRTGIFMAIPRDRQTGEMFDPHALTLIRVDRAGNLTLGTWGEKYRGLLRMREGTQWFIPDDAEKMEFQIIGMQRFIPFTPTAHASR